MCRSSAVGRLTFRLLRRLRLARLMLAQPGYRQRALLAHRRIVEAVTARDAEEAARP
jgi:DNA-binding FadR family transcriptional regulator